MRSQRRRGAFGAAALQRCRRARGCSGAAGAGEQVREAVGGGVGEMRGPRDRRNAYIMVKNAPNAYIMGRMEYMFMIVGTKEQRWNL